MSRTTDAALAACCRLNLRNLGTVIGIAICILLVSCGKPVNTNDQPVSYWADPKNPTDSDLCTHATAQAIIKSGLPYPHFTTHEVVGSSGKVETRNKTVEVWVGATRFLLPAQLVRDNGMYATNHPMRFWGLGGSLPNFYPVGEPGLVVDGMGAMVDVTIRCSVEPAYAASWGKGFQTNAEGIEKSRLRYIDNIKILAPERRDKATVTTNIRQDLGMTEVLFDRAGIYTDGQPQWEATYWPLNKELKGPAGSVSGIGCTTRNDPQKRYGGTGWRCGASLSLSPQATARIEIYVSQLQHMPVIFEQARQLFETAKQN